MSEESRPLSGKEKYDRFGFADRLQNISILLYHTPSRKSARTKLFRSRIQQEKVPNRVFYEINLCNLIGLFIPQFFIQLCIPSSNFIHHHHLKMLDLKTQIILRRYF